MIKTEQKNGQHARSLLSALTELRIEPIREPFGRIGQDFGGRYQHEQGQGAGFHGLPAAPQSPAPGFRFSPAGLGLPRPALSRQARSLFARIAVRARTYRRNSAAGRAPGR